MLWLLPQLETMKSLRGDRENIGIELYGVQQQLARQQMLLEQEQDKQTAMSQLRKEKYETLTQVRELYRNMQKQVEEERHQSKNWDLHTGRGDIVRLVLSRDQGDNGPYGNT